MLTAQTMDQIKSVVNSYGETVTRWTSHKHPEAVIYQQTVTYSHYQKPDGRNLLVWSLGNQGHDKNYYIYDITLEEALNKFTDPIIPEITEEQFQAWLLLRDSKK